MAKALKTIRASIKDITVTGAALDALIQQTGVDILEHYEAHHNTSAIDLFNEMIAGMPKGARINALREWFNTFGAVVYNEKTKLFVADKRPEAKNDIEGAKAKEWTEMKPEAPYKPMDLTKAVAALIAKAKKVADDPQDGDKVDPAMLAKLVEFSATELTTA